MAITSATNDITGITYVAGVAIPKPGVLQSESFARLVNLISEGPVQGLANATNPLQSVYFNGTVVQDPSTLSMNFAGVEVTQAYGTPSQAYIPGFSSAETPVSIATVLTHATPLVHTTSTGNVDAARVTMQFPNGLQSIDGKGNSNPTSVTLNIYTKLTSSGTWVLFFAGDVTNGKADPGYQKDYYITRPAGTGTWDIKVERVTADSATPNTLVNATTWYAMTEIQDVKQAYANSALVDITFDSKNAPSPFPMTFDYYGILCSVPSNYNATTRVYSGVWDGTFTTTKVWTDNPAWHLYELLTNTRWGMGNFISASQIDLASLYAAGVYNDGLVSDGNGGTEPRFRFNSQITVDEDAWKFLQTFASTFNAMIICSASGLVTVIQDRPTSSTVMVTNSMVSEAGFQYSSGAGSTRPTSTRVSFNDVNNNWQLREIVETDTSTTFPFLQTSVAAWGCTSEGQARRIARWNNDTNLRNTQIVNYRAPLHHLNVAPGTVITIADSFAAGINDGGKVLSVSGTTVNLDRPITVTAGTNTLMIRLQDGVTLATATITNAVGTYSTVTISAALPQAVTPGADFILSNTVSPQTYRVTDIKEVSDDNGYWFEVTAIQYDPTKYSRIETGVSVAAPVFYNSTASQVVPTAVSGLTYVLQSATAIDTVTRDLKVSWTPGTSNSTYYVQYRKSGDTWTEVPNVGQPSFLIKNVSQGSYDINVYAISSYGIQSPVCSGSYGVDLTGSTTPVINPVTNLIAVGGGTAFTTPDLSVQWTNPTTNANLNPALKDFVVNVYTSGGTLLRSETVAAVAPGASATYTYTYTKNLADNANVPIRSVRIDVVARDGLNNLVTATSTTFTNVSPATPSGITATGGIGSVFVSMTLPTDIDYKGVMVWASLTSGFTPSTANKVFDGSDAQIQFKQLGTGIHYIKVAAYDTFGKSDTGSGMNVSSQVTATPLASAGIPSYASTPGAGASGDFYWNTTDKQLYVYNGTAWVLAVVQVPAGGITGSITSAQIASVAAATVTGTLVDSQIAALAASKLTGTVSSAQIAANAVTAAKTSIAAIDPTTGNLVANSVTSSQIVAGTIVGADIAAGTITGSNIAATTITGGLIAGSTILGSNIAGGTITAGNLSANIITTGYLAAGAVTANEIAASTITGAKIAATTIAGSNLIANTITAGQIAASTITSAQIAANTIVAGNLAANSVTAASVATNAITTPAINGGAVCQVRNTAFNSASNNSYTVHSNIGLNATLVYSLVQTSSYTTYCYGSREIKLVGFLGTWVYNSTVPGVGTATNGIWHPAIYVRRVVNGTPTVIWTSDYTGSGTDGGAFSPSGTLGSLPTAGLGSDITILDDTSLGTAGTAVTLYYDVCFATTQMQASVPSDQQSIVGVNFAALPYAGQRFISMVEYQK